MNKTKSSRYFKCGVFLDSKNEDQINLKYKMGVLFLQTWSIISPKYTHLAELVPGSKKAPYRFLPNTSQIRSSDQWNTIYHHHVTEHKFLIIFRWKSSFYTWVARYILFLFSFERQFGEWMCDAITLSPMSGELICSSNQLQVLPKLKNTI